MVWSSPLDKLSRGVSALNQSVSIPLRKLLSESRQHQYCFHPTQLWVKAHSPRNQLRIPQKVEIETLQISKKAPNVSILSGLDFVLNAFKCRRAKFPSVICVDWSIQLNLVLNHLAWFCLHQLAKLSVSPLLGLAEAHESYVETKMFLSSLCGEQSLVPTQLTMQKGKQQLPHKLEKLMLFTQTKLIIVSAKHFVCCGSGTWTHLKGILLTILWFSS